MTTFQWVSIMRARKCVSCGRWGLGFCKLGAIKISTCKLNRRCTLRVVRTRLVSSGVMNTRLAGRE